jgi:tetratricopeptide (TPR) repeat protein
MQESGNKQKLVWIGLVLTVVTAVVYWPVLGHEFINYDDPDYVTTNQVVQKGLTWDGINWAFTTGHASNWHPLTWVSHMLDVHLFGLNPGGHHATNLVFHLANTLLLLLLLHQMTGAVWRSALVAAFFALHPLRVESVAWVAERKDVLSAFFGLLTLMAYVAYAKSRVEGRGSKAETALWYIAAVGLFALGLMSKPMLVTWPFVMLLLDWWPLGRISTVDGRWTMEHGKAWRRRLVEKIPFLVLVVASSTATLLAQRAALAETEVLPLPARFGNAVVSYVVYLRQTVWPTDLAVFYPFPPRVQPVAVLTGAAILAGISILVFRRRRVSPFGVTGWAWYLMTLVPVIGLVQVGAQAHADRYTYLPLIGIYVAVVWGLHALIQTRQAKHPVITAGLLSVVLIGLAVLSRTQLRHWQNDRTLCMHATQVTENNYVAWGGLGIAEVKATNWPAAMSHLQRAYEYSKPHHTERSVSYYLGVALQMQGKPIEALPYLENAMVSPEMQPERDHRLGLSLIEVERWTEAEAALKSALAAKPGHLNYQLGLAALYSRLGRKPEAEALHRQALIDHPETAFATKAYGDFLMETKRGVEAVPYYRKAVDLKPAEAAYRRAYVAALRHAGDFAEAIEQLGTLEKLAPHSAEDHLTRAEVRLALGQTQLAIQAYEHVLAINPDSVGTLNDLAWLLATHREAQFRNGQRAVELSERACQLAEWREPVLMGTLAAAYAEAGRFEEAIAMATKARDKARELRLETVVQRNEQLLELYRAHKPVRE